MNMRVEEKIPTSAEDARTIIDCVSRGEKVPQEVRERVRARAESITERVYQEFGLLDIGLPAIRELRDR